MKQNEKQSSYSIAWFKIAECVLRGEKERALGVHRLLSHSIGDTALSHQLEGDILFSCGDTQKALQAYKSAGHQYTAQGKYEQAAGVYEHMLTLKPTDSLIYNLLLNVYILSHIPSKIVQTAFSYIYLLTGSADNIAIQKVLDELHPIVSIDLQIQLCERVLHILYVQEDNATALRDFLIKKIVSLYYVGEYKDEIGQFLQRLGCFMPNEVEFALSCIHKYEEKNYK